MVGTVVVVWPIVRVAPIVILAIVVVSVIGLPIIVASVVGLAVVTRFSHSIYFNPTIIIHVNLNTEYDTLWLSPGNFKSAG